MYGPVDLIRLPGAVKLGYDHRGAAGQAHKETHQQINQGAGASTHRSQGLLSHKAAHHHGIRRIIQLLEKRSEQYGKEKQQQLSENASFRNTVSLYNLSSIPALMFCTFSIKNHKE